jgi:hypothetical protein
MSEISHNYMMSRPGEGSCNPYAHAGWGERDSDHSWIGDFDGMCNGEKRMEPKIVVGYHGAPGRPSRAQISLAAKRLLRQAWQLRKSELRDKGFPDPFGVIDPVQILRDLGRSVRYLDTLGRFTDLDGEFEVAGQIDPSAMAVRLSKQFSPEVMRFTAAHELGHTVLHPGMSAHRDRPVDGTRSLRGKDPAEADADYFAACLLMPEKLVMDEFAARFLTRKFVLNDDVAIALGYPTLSAAQNDCRAQGGLAWVLAGAEFFNGHHFLSLAEQFQVSVSPMVIRLQELGLVAQRSPSPR